MQRTIAGYKIELDKPLFCKICKEKLYVTRIHVEHNLDYSSWSSLQTSQLIARGELCCPACNLNVEILAKEVIVNPDTKTILVKNYLVDRIVQRAGRERFYPETMITSDLPDEYFNPSRRDN